MGYDFNDWRKNYDHLSCEEQQKEYSKIYEAGPVQRYFDLALVKKFLLQYKPFTVLEIGGWDGALAGEILSSDSFDFVLKWYNLEICREAVQNGLKNVKYVPTIPEKWVWEIELPEADTFIASHFIEHIKVKHLKQLLYNLPESIKSVFLQAPIWEDDGNVWDRCYGSHILEVGWKQVERMLEEKCFKKCLSSGEVRIFSKNFV